MELLYLFIDWFSVIVYDVVMETLMRMILALVAAAIVAHLIYKRYYD